MVVLVVVLGALYTIDKRLKTGGPEGFLAPSTQWQVAATDLPAAWEQWRGLDSCEAFRTHAPDVLQSLPVAVRKITGVRPTPERLRLWLGAHAVLSGDRDGWSVSFRPGLLMRVASLFVSPARPVPLDGDQPAWARCAWGWREGVVVLASSTAYLDRVLLEGTPVVPSERPNDVLSITWSGDTKMALDLTLEDHLPFSLAIADIAATEQSTLRHGAGWSDAVCWGVLHDEGISQALAGVAREMASFLMGDDWLNAGRSIVRAPWDAAIPIVPGDDPKTERAMGIFKADFEADIPELEVIWVQVGDPANTLAYFATWMSPREHRWNETTGWLYPLPGEARAVAAAFQGETLYVTSHEHSMPLLLAGDPGEGVPGVAAFGLQWKSFSAALAGLMRRAADGGLLPEHNAEDIASDVLPVFEALGDWGRFEMELTAGEDGGLRGQGYLALGPDSL